jgi:hypothetical protein
MAQQNIIIGTQDAKAGDTLFSAFTKTEANFTDLYGNLGSNNTVYIRTEADLPNQTATTWTMNPNVPYKLAASFSTSLQAIPANGSSLRGDNVSSYTLTYTGTGSMFKGTDVGFYINNISLDAGINNTCFEFIDTVGGIHNLIIVNVSVANCALWGKFTNLRIAQVFNCDGRNATNGVKLFGTSNLTWSFTQFALSSTNPSFIGIDLGSATATLLEFSNLFQSAPAGAFGISGLANSGNVPAGRLGSITGSEFLGGMTDLQNISVNDDTRWRFSGNSPTPDTFPDSLISFRGNATETIIGVVNTPVLVAGTWVDQGSSLFSTTAAGRVTSLSERPLKAPVTISAGLISSGGGSIAVTLYLAKDGVVDVASGIDVTISGSLAETLTIPWQVTFAENEYVEVFVENNTNTTNVIVDHAILRVL